MAAAPGFTLDLLARTIESKRISGSHLSELRALYVGAEPLFQDRIKQFENSAQKAGLKANTVQTCYGLAESVIGVAISRSGTPLINKNISKSLLRRSGVARATEDSNDSVTIVQAGPPVDDIEILIADEHRNPIPQPARGRIWIKGPSVTEGYWGEAESPLREGWLDTGDEGFLLDGQLYVCGRSKDTLIRGGVNYDAHEIEDAVLQALDIHVPELRCRTVAVFAVRDEAQQRERVVAMLELRRPPADPDTLFDRIRAAVLERTGLGLDDLAHCPSLPRTTSGKLQRNLARELYLEAAA